MRRPARSPEGLARQHDELIRAATELPEPALTQFLATGITGLVREGNRTPDRARRLFLDAEAAGVHVMPVQPYSPIPDTRQLPPSLWTRPFDLRDTIDLRVAEQRAWLETVGPWMAELADVPADGRDADGTFYWLNRWFPPVDARVSYALMRQHQPKLVIEVGGGYSTMIAARAAARNGRTEVITIEPQPRPALRKGLAGMRLIEAPLESVDPALFDRLGDGDMLFIDSSHSGRIGSDVTHAFFNVFPRLAPGVFVHIHDIFLPWDYPSSWALDRRTFFTEQYLLQAFLMFNGAYEIQWLSSLLMRDHIDDVARHLGPLPRPEDYAASASHDAALMRRREALGDPQPSSAWIRRQAARITHD